MLIEDHRDIAEMVFDYLENQGYKVDYAADGVTGLHLGIQNDYDAVVLDLMLPGIDGLDVCRRLRSDAHVDAPVLMLTARDTLEDKLLGFDSGADDYLVKPFAFAELLARVRSLLRREGMAKTPEIRIGDLILNSLTRDVRRGSNTIDLTNKEYVILEYLMRNPNVVLSRTLIEEHAWNYDFGSVSNLIDVYVRRLRNKLGDDGKHELIQTVRGAGYRLRA